MMNSKDMLEKHLKKNFQIEEILQRKNEKVAGHRVTGT